METENKHQAIARGLDLGISAKDSIEICNCIRKKSTEKAKKILLDSINKIKPIPFLRFNRDRGHKHGRLYSGAYPNKAAKAILKLIEAAEKNAQNQGLNPESLFIKSIIPNRAAEPSRYGRQRSRETKRAHVYITVEEKEPKQEKKKREAKK
jgi:large subunit ribosomal protein L22